MGKAYDAMPKEQGGHFWIKSARHLAGPLRALKDPAVRMVIIIGATQVMKSIAGDIWIPYLLEFYLSNILVLFETDPKALLYCDTRFMGTIKNHPVLAGLFSDVSRHDLTKTEIKMSGAKLLVGGLNDSNVSSLSWKYIWISESWQHGSDGLLGKAIKRADRFPDDKKILIESQAGWAGEDLHTEAKAAHQVPLTWACPACGGRQTWEFSKNRPEDFVPKEIIKVNCVTIGGQTAFVAQPPKPGSYSGMTFDSGENLTIDQRARTARWECYHCGHHIEDTKANRQALMDTYEQDYKILGPDGLEISPKSVCFYLPKESARDNSFEDSAKSYLTAKDSLSKDNKIPIQNWYMSERAVFFEEKLIQPKITIATGSYDPKAIIENEHHRGLVVDCQKHLEEDTVGTFWYSAYVADKSGNSFEIERGFATSWEEWIAVQKRWKIPNHYVCVDGRKWTPIILKQAAAHYEIVKGKLFGRGREVTMHSTWRIFLGDVARHFKWPDNQYRIYSPPTYRREIIINAQGQQVAIMVPMFRWSNLSAKDQLKDLLIGGEGKPKFLFLNRSQLTEKNQLIEVGDLTHEMQMSSEYRTEKNGKATYENIRKENHQWDNANQRLVRMAMDGLAGHQMPPD